MFSRNEPFEQKTDFLKNNQTFHIWTQFYAKYCAKELCETEKRIRQLESVISDLNFELEKIDLAETAGLGADPGTRGPWVIILP